MTYWLAYIALAMAVLSCAWLEADASECLEEIVTVEEAAPFTDAVQLAELGLVTAVECYEIDGNVECSVRLCEEPTP